MRMVSRCTGRQTEITANRAYLSVAEAWDASASGSPYRSALELLSRGSR
jgi:hypothetical protein